MNSHVEIANGYIDDVLDGKISACKYVKLACERQKKDLVKQDFEYRFDKDKANRICKFIELLPHIKGEWAGRLITLEPWQCFILTTVFGWVDEDGFRRFNTCYIEVPRKNAKSTLSSGVALYGLAADGEGGAEVYSAATTRDQARIVFEDAKRMVDRCQGLQQRFGVTSSAHSVYVAPTASSFKALSRDHGGNLDGLNVHFGIIDELHAHKTREVHDVIDTATGARRQPLLWEITTAGFNRAGICYEQRAYLIKVLQRVTDDPEFFGIIYTIDDTDDWADPKSWEKANPNWGISVKPKDIGRKARKAMEMASAQNNFLTKHLNVWVNADTAWMDMRKWEACGDSSLDISDFEGEECYVGIDLASKIDIASCAILFKKFIENKWNYYVFGRNWLPEYTIEQSSNSQYEGWALDGYLVETPGEIIDYDFIEEYLKQISSRFQVVQCAYDPFQATQFSTRMTAADVPMIEVGATVKNFSDPMKEFEALVVSGRFHHDGSPLVTWMLSNVVCHMDKKENIFPNKEFPANKIDWVIAVIMALSRSLIDDSGSAEPSISFI